MYYTFDIFGWLSGTSATVTQRSTEVEPPITTLERIEGVQYPNFSGYVWNMQTYIHQDPPVEQEQPEAWFIDIGPFFDRFGSQKLTVLSSTNSTVKAIIQDVQVRKWVDLKRPDVAQALDIIGSVIPAITPELRQGILNTPVTFEESRALRKLYF